MPYAPGIEYRGDQYLYQGIAGASDALAKGIQRFKEERKQTKETNAAFDSLGGSLEKLISLGAVSPEWAKRYSAAANADTATKQGLLKGLGMGMEMLGKATQTKVEGQREDRLGRQTDAQVEIMKAQEQRQADQYEAMQRMQRFMTLHQGSLTPNDVMHYGIMAGALDPKTQADLLSTMSTNERNKTSQMFYDIQKRQADLAEEKWKAQQENGEPIDATNIEKMIIELEKAKSNLLTDPTQRGKLQERIDYLQKTYLKAAGRPARRVRRGPDGNLTLE